jgi:hypothetical protein
MKPINPRRILLQQRVAEIQEAISTVRRPLKERAPTDETSNGIVDRRSLEFNSQAILAVVAFAATKGNSARPSKITFNGNGVVLGFQNNTTTIPVTTDQLARLFVAYCAKVNIPLPQNVTKTVTLTAASAILQFETVYADPPIPNATSWDQNAPGNPVTRTMTSTTAPAPPPVAQPAAQPAARTI